MNVQVIDVKTGQVKTMPKRYANILVKMKRAHWPEVSPDQHKALITTEPAAVADEDEPADGAPKKRGRKPNFQE